MWTAYNAVNIIRENQILGFSAAIALILVLVVRYLQSPYRKLPPGLRGVPILGSALSLQGPQCMSFTKWKEAYGDVISFSALGQRIVVLNTHKAAADLLDSRVGIRSDRPQNIVAGQILASGMSLAFQGHNVRWRRTRRAAHEALNRTVAVDFQDTQLLEALVLAGDMLK